MVQQVRPRCSLERRRPSFLRPSLFSKSPRGRRLGTYRVVSLVGQWQWDTQETEELWGGPASCSWEFPFQPLPRDPLSFRREECESLLWCFVNADKNLLHNMKITISKPFLFQPSPSHSSRSSDLHMGLARHISVCPVGSLADPGSSLHPPVPQLALWHGRAWHEGTTLLPLFSWSHGYRHSLPMPFCPLEKGTNPFGKDPALF